MSGALQTLGERFRAAREARGLSLSDAAEQIRIRSVYLAAIEDENWSAVGAPVYVRGFLRTYARYLGLDPEEAVAEFGRTLGGPATAAAGSEEGSRRGGRWGSILVGLAAAVAIVLVAFVVYNELTMRRGVTVAQTTPGSPAPSEAPSTAPSDTPGVASPATPVQTAARAAGAPGQPNSIALVLSAPSWLRVTVDGNVSMEGTFPAGTSKTFHGRKALVRLGNAGGVEIYVDGKPVGKLGKSGDVVERAFTL